MLVLGMLSPGPCCLFIRVLAPITCLRELLVTFWVQELCKALYFGLEQRILSHPSHQRAIS